MTVDNIPVLNYSIKSTPWYFGAYLNMARHNVYLLINHITDKFSYIKHYTSLNDLDVASNPKPFSKLTDDGAIDKENILTKIFDTSCPQYDNDRFLVYKYLVRKHYLPFIKNFSNSGGRNLEENPEIDYDELHQFINEAFALLVRLRDSFSHYLAIDGDGRQIYDRKLDISSCISARADKLFRDSPNYSIERFFATQVEADFEHLSLYRIFEDNGLNFSEQGLYFFINLFLERNYGIKFLKKIKGFKNETNPAFRATIKTFTAYALKIPDERLDNDDPKMGLVMEILNELQKCPNLLYKHLHEDDRKIFEPILDDNSKFNIMLNSVNYESIEDQDIDNLLGDLTTLRRHQDRFPYFALRCLDELDLLSNIRFQLTLGTVEYRSYDKTVGGITIDRRIVKKLKTFGKLSQFAGKQDQVTVRLKQYAQNEDIVFEQYNPHYNISNNKIGFYISANGEEVPYHRNVLPHGFLSINELPKLLLLALKSAAQAESTITDFLEKNTSWILDKKKLDAIRDKIKLFPSTFNRRLVHEKALKNKGRVCFLNKGEVDKVRKQHHITDEKLRNFDFMSSLISKTKNNRSQEYLKQINYLHVLESRKESLQSVLPSGVNVHQLPTRIVDYLLCMEPVDSNKQLIRRLKDIKIDTTFRLKQIDNDEEYPIKTGYMATFLARDIISSVVSKDIKDKITTAYYSRLQYKIAYLSISKDELATIIQELRLFDPKDGHPFLRSTLLVKSKGIKEFYELYLSAKLSWINNILSKKNLMEQIKNGSVLLPFKIRCFVDKLEMDDFDTWLANKVQMPVDLPVGVFDDKLNRCLKGELSKSNITFQKTDKFSVLLSKLLQDDRQPFYDYLRWYRTPDGEIPYSPDGHSSLVIKQNYSRYAESTEKKIRYTLTQDRILLLACQNLFGKMSQMDEPIEMALGDIFPFSKSNPLDRPVAFHQRLKGKGNKTIFVMAADTLEQRADVEIFNRLQTAAEREAYHGQKGYQWTVKDFGRFRRFVHDRRLSSIFGFVDAQSCSYDLLVYQIAEYDRYREAVFRLTFELEQHLASTYFDELVQLKIQSDAPFPTVQFKEYIALLKSKNILNTEELQFVKNIRNKFSHSEFPDYNHSLPKLTLEQIQDFESNKSLKDCKTHIDLSICKKLFSKYKEILAKCE